LSKKKPGEQKSAPAPVISKIPLPISDSPLVIDLPDGQKLVVGKMIQGSVIEVATWRGTGRPDSRTSRLMLGMSIGDVNPTPEEKAATEASGNAPTIHSATDAPQAPKSQAQAWLDYLAAKYPSLKFLKGKKIPQVKLPKVAAPKKGKAPKAKAAKAIANKPAVESVEGASIANELVAEESRPSTSRTTSSPKKKIGGFKAIKLSNSSGKKQAPSAEAKSFTYETSSDDDISAWLDQISEKARVRVEAESVAPAKSARTKPEVSLDDIFGKAGAAKKAPARRTNVAKKSASAPKKRK